ncbi:MAG: 50S ribosomal protein L9 [Roseiflexaceae bacterium]
MATKMKVLLTKDVEHLGVAGDIKEVSGGYGRNYLLPQGMAVIATRGAIKQAEERLSAQRKREAVLRQEAEVLAQRMAGVTLTFVERVGENDRLFGSVTASDIADKLQAAVGVDIDRRRIELDEPIKRIGDFVVHYRVMTGVVAEVKVVVNAAEGDA